MQKLLKYTKKGLDLIHVRIQDQFTKFSYRDLYTSKDNFKVKYKKFNL